MAAKNRKSSHGGARRRSGRKAGALPPELAEHVPSVIEAIKSPIKQQRYVSTLLMLLMDARVRPTEYSISVKSIDKLAKEIRASAAALSKIIPADIQFHAAQLLRDDEDDMKRDRGPEQEKRDPAKSGALVRATEA